MVEVCGHKPTTGKKSRHLKAGQSETTAKCRVRFRVIDLRGKNLRVVEHRRHKEHGKDGDTEEELALPIAECSQLPLKEKSEVQNKVHRSDQHEAGDDGIHIRAIEMRNAHVVRREPAG